MPNIPFNLPHFTGNELDYIKLSLKTGWTGGNGSFTQKCESFFQEKLHAKGVLLTSSCTDALEMCALLCGLKTGDEVIVPSYTFVSSALAFVRCGAKIVFADSMKDSPCIDADKLEPLITSHTKVIVVVHYAGIACDMDKIMSLALKHRLLVVEDAAQAIDSYYKGRPLGTIGHLAAFSFHESKNIQCGEGGMLVINDERFCKRAEILWEKGTDRAQFFRGEINKYGWKDTGSSFLPADYVAAFLWAQLEQLAPIQKRRIEIWNQYYLGLKDIGHIKLPYIPDYATNNGHIFYILCSSCIERSKLISYLKAHGINTAFHYLSLHKSDFVKQYQPNSYLQNLPFADCYTEQLLRLPLYTDLNASEVAYVINTIKDFYTYKN